MPAHAETPKPAHITVLFGSVLSAKCHIRIAAEYEDLILHTVSALVVLLWIT